MIDGSEMVADDSVAGVDDAVTIAIGKQREPARTGAIIQYPESRFLELQPSHHGRRKMGMTRQNWRPVHELHVPLWIVLWQIPIMPHKIQAPCAGLHRSAAATL